MTEYLYLYCPEHHWHWDMNYDPPMCDCDDLILCVEEYDD